jgi:WD40 repeat protein
MIAGAPQRREVIRGVRVEDFAFSPDGARLAIATSHEVIEVDTQSLRRRALYAAPAARLHYSPAGILAYVTHDLVGIVAGSSAARFGHPGVTDAAFIDDTRLVSVGTAADLRTWRLDTQLQPSIGDGLWEADRTPYELSARGPWLANNIGGLDAVVALDPATAGNVFDHVLNIVPGAQGNRAWIERGTRRDPQLRWDITPDGDTVALVTARGVEVGPRDGARTIACRDAERVVLAPDGRLVACFGDGRTALYEVPGARPVAVAVPAFQPRAFSPDHRWLAGTTADAIVIDRTDTGARVITDPLPATGNRTAGVDEVELSRDGRYAAIALDNGTVRVWQLPDGRLARTIELGVAGSTHVRFLPSGLLTVAGASGTVQMFAIATSDAPRILHGPTSALASLAVSPDGARIAAGGARGEVWLWDVASGAGVQLWSHDFAVVRIAFAPNGLVTMSARGGLRAVRLGDPAGLASVTTVRIDRDGQAWSSK